MNVTFVFFFGFNRFDVDILEIVLEHKIPVGALDFFHAVKPLLLNGKLSSDHFVAGFTVPGNDNPVKINKLPFVNVKGYVHNGFGIIFIRPGNHPDIGIPWLA